MLTLYTVSAAVSLGTFHRPKPTRGISLPEAKVVVDLVIVINLREQLCIFLAS